MSEMSTATTTRRSPRKISAMRGAPEAPMIDAPAPKLDKRSHGSAAARFRELIAAGGMSDADIHATVEREFNRKIAKTAVSHYRKKLKELGASLAEPETEIAPPRRGRKPKAQANGNGAAMAATPAVKRPAAHQRLIDRIDALVAQHDVKKLGKLLDAVEALG